MKTEQRNHNLSIVIVTKNEEKNIKDCLKTVGWADEIIVVDMESTDRTRKIARKLGARVFVSDGGPYKLIPYNKNLGFKKAKGKWIFAVDADERVSKKLGEEIMKVIKGSNIYSAYKVRIPTYFWGKWIIYGWDPYQIRLFKKSKTKGYTKNIAHDHLRVDGEVGKLNSPIYHFGHMTIEEFIKKMNLYTTQDANSKITSGAEGVPWYKFFKDPVANFYYQYFKLKGYKHGLHGLVMCIFMSIYYFIERAKLWEMQFKSEEDELHKYDKKY